MKMKNFSSLLKEVATMCRAAGNAAFASDLENFVKCAKPFEKLETSGLFTFDLIDSSDATQVVERDSQMSARDLSRTLEATSALLKAAGSSAKSKDLASIASEIGAHGATPVGALINGVHGAQHKAMMRRAEDFCRRLTDFQLDEAAFNSVLTELKKQSVDIANAVAVAYVQGKSKYPSKPKAIAAIADKRFERARLATRMGQH